jgi:type I restriction enzyme, S subunit
MSEWRTAQLSEVADIRVSNVDKKTSPAELVVRLCNYMDVYSNDYIRANLSFMVASATGAEFAKFKVNRGDVLITKDSEAPDDIGIAAVVDDEIDDLVCGYHLALIKPNRRLIDSVFLSKQLGSAESSNYFLRYAAGSTRYGLSNGAIANTKIRFPSLWQQRKIATILTSIDTTIEKTEALIEKYQHIKAGLMHDLFTRGVLPNGQLRPPRDQAPALYQETAIGWIPKEWHVAEIERILNRIIDYRGKTPEKTVAGIPLITAKNVRMGYIDPEPREFIAESAYASWMTRGIPIKGDILFTTEAPLGNVAQVPSDERVAFAQRAIILQPSDCIDASFLAYRLMTEATQTAIARLASGSTALGIKQSEFRKVCISYPCDKSEQLEIFKRARSLDSFLDEERSTLRKLQIQKLGLMQDLLTGKVAVKVDAQDLVTVA